MRLFLSFTRLWVLAVPFALTIVGAGMNQAVFVANHDRFPVSINSAKFRAYEAKALKKAEGDEDHESDTTDLYNLEKDGMLDYWHCIMGTDTHLNFLADFIDLHNGTYSPGDILLELGDYLTPFAPFVWGLFLLTDKLRA